MSGFQNPHQMNNSTYQVFSYISPNHPGVSSMWIDGTTQNMASYNGNVSPGYQQQGQIMYPFNLLQNSSGYGSQINLDHPPQTFLENIHSQNSLRSPGIVMSHSTPNLTSLVSPISPLVNNPQFLQHNFRSPQEQLIAQPAGILHQLSPTAYGISQHQVPASLAQLNVNYQQQQMWQQHQQEQLQKEQNYYQQRILHQQEHLQALSQQSNQATLNENTTYLENEDLNQNLTETQDEYSIHTATTGYKTGPFYIASVQAASPSSYHQGSSHPRQNTLPGSLPTSLNPSLQIKSNVSPMKAVSLQKSTNLGKAPGSLQNGVVNTKSEVQGGQNTTGKDSSVLISVSTSESSPPSSQLGRTDKQRSDHNVLKPSYARPKNKDGCLRCHKKVYPMERTGPIKEVVYHKACFTCAACGTTLNLKNFHHNPNDAEDLSVFCNSHKPKERTLSCDADAVYIKSALTSPKLDKVNEQIRTDRHPSEVLARSGYFQPAASSLSTARENFYYGMGAAENSTSEKLREPPLPQEQHIQSKEQHHQQSQEQQQYHQNNLQLQQPHKNEQQQHSQILEPPHQSQHKLYQHEQQQYQELLQQNIQLQHQISENEKRLINGLANVTVSDTDETNTALAYEVTGPLSHNGQVDDIKLSSNSNQIISGTVEDNNDVKSPTSSLSSSMSSSMMQQESISGDSLDDYLATHFILDNDVTLYRHTQNTFRTGEVEAFANNERPSSQSSRSTSPMQIQNSSRSTEDNESRRSSSSSNLSSRDSVDLGASAQSYSGRQQLTPSPYDRADRPSSFQNTQTFEKPREKSSPARMIEKEKITYNLETPRSVSDDDRFLPKNERMRLDRPSQYS